MNFVSAELQARGAIDSSTTNEMRLACSVRQSWAGTGYYKKPAQPMDSAISP
jgi:hypothetical protein